MSGLRREPRAAYTRHCLWLAVWGASCAALGLARPAVPDDPGIPTIHLQVGESKTVALGAQVDVNVSRRGVVDIKHLQKDRWLLTGLTRGLILLTMIDNLTNATRKRLLRVGAKDRRQRDGWDWLCSSPGIRCRAGARVEGRIPSVPWLQRAAGVCARTTGCHFALDPLTASQLEALEVALQRIDRSIRLRRTRSGPILEHLCTDGVSGETDAAVLHTATALALPVRCRQPPRSWILTVLARHSGDHRHRQRARLDPLALSPEAAAATLVQEQAARRTGQTQAFPEVTLATDAPATVRSGGEIPIETTNEHGAHVSWKVFGVTLKAHVKARRADRLLAEIHIDLATPLGTGVSPLASHKLHTTTWLPYTGAPTPLGTVTLERQQSASERFVHLRAVPIIGPWFAGRVSDKSSTRLHLQAALRRPHAGDSPSTDHVEP